MNFWDKKGDNNNIFDDEFADSSDLLDVSNLDIPLEDQNDQYNEEVPIEGGNVQSFPSFMDTTSKKAPAIPKSPAGNKSFMAPPIPSAPFQAQQKTSAFEQASFNDDLPPLPEDDMGYEDDLPPLPEDDMGYEDDLPPLPEDDMGYEDDLPPLPEDDIEYEDDLPPLPEDDIEYEDDLPPLPEGDVEYEDAIPSVPEDNAEYEDDLPPLPEDEAEQEDKPYNTELPQEPEELSVQAEKQTQIVTSTEPDSSESTQVIDKNPETQMPKEEEQPVSQSLTSASNIDKNQDSSNPIPQKQEEPIKKEEFYIRTAQAPRSKTFVKQAEDLLSSTIEAKDEADVSTSTASSFVDQKQNEDIENLHYSNPLFLRKLFANGNTCITAPGATFQLKEDLRSLLALFSNGRYFVAETYKYDGKVLSFEYLVKKRHLQIGKPEYVPMNVLSTIYEYAAQNTYTEEDEEISEKPDVVEQAQARMQRDFITIVSRAAAMHVSDIHVVVAENTIVMFRVNGLMQTEMEYKKEWGESFVRAAFASADISDANYAQNEYQAAQKLGRTPLRGSHGKLVLPKNILGIRLQFNPIAFGTRYVVLRLLYAEENIETSSALEALGFTKKDTEDFYKLRGMPTGITIISGPTGSGKSTTLQRNMIAMLQERNYEVNLITVEDPPEYPIPGARQMPVTNATIEEAKEREFTKALAAALRSDPDSMMIGEVRTLSAADLAFRAALSGHNVWTTLHANNAPSILIRLKDMGVEEFKLKDPEIMKGLTAQRLFRRLCPHCRIPTTNMLHTPIVQRLREGFGDVALETTYLRGPGCRQCDFKGVKGRIAVSEIILPDATFLDLMMKGDTVKATNYWINELNGTTLRESALRHMFNGIIDVAEVERWTGFLDQTITG